MSSYIDFSYTTFLHNSVVGGLRGLFVEACIYPIEVVKVRQQCAATSETSLRLAKQVLQTEGYKAFYQGLTPQLCKTGIRHCWSWPLMTHMPKFLASYGFGTISQQVCTGLTIAVFDATITTPLERTKLTSAFSGKSLFSIRHIYSGGWQGLTTYLIKRAVNNVAFLIAQQSLRDHYRQKSEILDLPVLIKIGIQVAAIVSVVSTPFDFANTMKQTHNRNISCLFSQHGITRLYRGWPLNTLLLTIHHIASVILMEMLSQKNSRDLTSKSDKNACNVK